MTKEIQFTQSESGWEHSFSSTGAVAVQVNAKSAGRILVYASLDGLSRALVGGNGESLRQQFLWH